MADEVGVGVIGAGYWGSNLIRNFVHANGWDLRWVCDLDPERSARALGKRTAVAVTTSLDEVLGDAGVAAVVVATPADTHAHLTTQALAADRHVLVEKPLASSLPEG